MDLHQHAFVNELESYDEPLALRSVSSVQFQMPHFVLGGTPSLARGGGAEVLPGMYGQGPQAWSEYDKYWCVRRAPSVVRTHMPQL
jgi:hypothetical protein